MIKKSLCTWWLQYRKLQVMFKVSPASLQTFINTPNLVLEDRVQYSTVRIPNVFCDVHLQIINCVGIVRIHWNFLIALYIFAYVWTKTYHTVSQWTNWVGEGKSKWHTEIKSIIFKVSGSLILRHFYLTQPADLQSWLKTEVMFAVAMTIRVLVSLTSLWAIRLSSIGGWVDVVILATGIHLRQGGS
jgi:hypothetical protein